MKRFKILISALFVTISFAGLAATAHAADGAQASVCEGIGLVSDTGGCVENTSEPTVEKLIRGILKILSYVVGAVSIIMIVIGGLKYATSRGESAAVKGAKDTILYAIIGIVVAVLAQVIIRFVLTEVTTDPPATPTGGICAANPNLCDPNANNEPTPEPDPCTIPRPAGTPC